MTIDVDHFLALGVVVRVGAADAWAVTRRLLSEGVRIGTEEQLARRKTAEHVRVISVEPTTAQPEVTGTRS